MMSVYRRGNHVSTLVLPITGDVIEFMGEIYVDDTDLLTILQDVFDSDEVLRTAQKNLDKWTELLMATGGALNPDKCYWYMVSYVCRDGEWFYDDTNSFELTIILPDGTRRAITQLWVTDKENARGMVCTKRVGQEAPRGISSWENNQIGRQTEELPPTSALSVEGVSLPAVARNLLWSLDTGNTLG
jgi:hypothetical protein